LKEKVGYKKQDIARVQLEQQEEYSRAVCGCDEYELFDEYKHLEDDYTERLQMTPEKHKPKIEKGFILVYSLQGISKPIH